MRVEIGTGNSAVYSNTHARAGARACAHVNARTNSHTSRYARAHINPHTQNCSACSKVPSRKAKVSKKANDKDDVIRLHAVTPGSERTLSHAPHTPVPMHCTRAHQVCTRTLQAHNPTLVQSGRLNARLPYYYLYLYLSRAAKRRRAEARDTSKAFKRV
jgi:hypothetical protein